MMNVNLKTDMSMNVNEAGKRNERGGKMRT